MHPYRNGPMQRLALIVAVLALWPVRLLAVDEVLLRRDGKQVRVAGRLLVTAEDGGLLLVAPDGLIWAVQPQELIEHKHDDEPFVPLTHDKLAKQLLKELPTGFETHSTAHYLICYNTSREYANWCGALFERLYRGFATYWPHKGVKLHEPEFPLVAVVFNERQPYVQFSKSELGTSGESIPGYYSFRSNRMVMHDLTGIESLRAAGARRGSSAQISQTLAHPDAEPLVATIIHEATHQIAFNSGLQTRYADIPLWLSEGIAMYFETPDLSSPKGWRTIGAVNRGRLDRFRENLAGRGATSLKSLTVDDKRLRDPRQATDAYAEAWALNYYLLRQHPKEYVAYLKMLSEKKQMIWDTPEKRLREFEAAFGGIDRLDADFLRQMQKVR